MHVEGGVVLDHHMNIAEVPFQWVAAVDRIGSGRLEHDIDRANVSSTKDRAAPRMASAWATRACTAVRSRNGTGELVELRSARSMNASMATRAIPSAFAETMTHSVTKNSREL